MSSKAFQKKLNGSLECIAGVICVANDTIVTGCGATQMLAESDRDDNRSDAQRGTLN